MVTPTFLPYLGGQEVYVQKLSEKLVERGHEVTIFTTDAVSRIPFRRIRTEDPEREPFTVVRFPCYGFLYSYLPVTPRLALALLNREIRRQDVVHAHGFGHFTSDMVALARRMFGVPAVLTTHGIHQESGQEGVLRSLLWHYYRDSLVRFTLESVDRILALSPDETRYLARFGSDVHRKTRVIPIGVETQDYNLATQATTQRRPMILYLGRIYPGKGLEFLIEAVSRLKRYDPLLMLAGEKTDFVGELQELAKNRQVSENVVFTGFVDEQRKRRILSEASVFCLPSKYEGASLVTLEAMAAGKPVVATRAGGLPYLVDDRSSGYLVRYGDVDGIAACLERIITDQALSDEMGRKARAIAERHSWTNVTEMVEENYLELVEDIHSRHAD